MAKVFFFFSPPFCGLKIFAKARQNKKIKNRKNSRCGSWRRACSRRDRRRRGVGECLGWGCGGSSAAGGGGRRRRSLKIFHLSSVSLSLSA
jgi:hypothetical protein